MASVYTRTGDEGTTSLADGSRVRKDDPRIEVLGALDEASTRIGLARVHIVETDLDQVFEFIQQRIFNCSALIATPAPGPTTPGVEREDVELLESAIDSYSERIGGFTGFLLPGCDESSARVQVARTAMRRAERRLVTLADVAPVDPLVLAFVNRASDFLYVAARYSCGGGEAAWDPKAARPPM